MTAMVRARWLAVVLAGLCVMVMAPGGTGYAAVSRGQASHDLATAVPAGGAPPPAQAFLTAVACASAADCVAIGRAGAYSLAEHWNGRTWTLVNSPRQVVSAVACARARLCQAVGEGSAERWNGRAWIVEKAPAALRGASLAGVACPGTSACVAVGSRSRGRPPVAETWNGTAWAAHNLANPPGAVQAGLAGVSCARRSFCIAVGNYQSAAGQFTLAEKWNGRTWTMLAMPPTGTPAGLVSVSCTSSASCVAIGSDPSGPLAESWNGTRWTVLPAPPATDVVAVSCAAATDCIAIGDVLGQGSAASWNGSSWTTLAQPALAPAIATLTGVSCPAAARCMGVGWTDRVGPFNIVGSFAMSWDGSAWRELRVNHADELSAVSCTRAAWCMATGSFATASGKIVALAESWNGTSWRLRPAFQGTAGSVLSDVSCVSDARCAAVGTVYQYAMLAEAWNGTAWRVTIAPGPLSYPTLLSAVSCRGVTCVAPGFGTTEVWNGTAWQQGPDVPEGELTDVSCVSPAHCMGVGDYIPDPDEPPASLSDLWNGTSWQQFGTANITWLNTVSCTSASFCMAAGANIAEIWNGTSWRALKFPGTFGTGGAGITGVSCVRRSACMAVGSYLATVGSRPEAFTVAEFWNGTRWRRLPTPGPGGGLTDVSCTSASRCMAVGMSPAGPAGTNVLAERWNGRRWSLLATPNP